MIDLVQFADGQPDWLSAREAGRQADAAWAALYWGVPISILSAIASAAVAVLAVFGPASDRKIRELEREIEHVRRRRRAVYVARQGLKALRAFERAYGSKTAFQGFSGVEVFSFRRRFVTLQRSIRHFIDIGIEHSPVILLVTEVETLLSDAALLLNSGNDVVVTADPQMWMFDDNRIASVITVLVDAGFRNEKLREELLRRRNELRKIEGARRAELERLQAWGWLWPYRRGGSRRTSSA